MRRRLIVCRLRRISADRSSCYYCGQAARAACRPTTLYELRTVAARRAACAQLIGKRLCAECAHLRPHKLACVACVNVRARRMISPPTARFFIIVFVCPLLPVSRALLLIPNELNLNTQVRLRFLCCLRCFCCARFAGQPRKTRTIVRVHSEQETQLKHQFASGRETNSCSVE